MSSYVTTKSHFLLAHPKMAQLANTLLARLIFTGQTSHLDMVYPKHSSFFRTFIRRDDYFVCFASQTPGLNTSVIKAISFKALDQS